MSEPPGPRITVQRLPYRLTRDASRMIARFFWPETPERAQQLVGRVTRLDQESVSRLLERCLEDFQDQHDDLLGVFGDHYEEVRKRLGQADALTSDHRLLIGAYFTMEYAYASAALFNPSIVPDIWRKERRPGTSPFMMSLRAVGEGHISSIVFRTGVIESDSTLTFDPVPQRSRRLEVVEDRLYQQRTFRSKLVEAGVYTDLAIR